MIDPSRYTRDELEKLAITQDALIRSLEGEIARLRVTEQEVKRLLARTMLMWDAETAKAANGGDIATAGLTMGTSPTL